MTDLATPQEIARTYGRKVGYVYNLASEYRWRKIRWQGRVYYRWGDADAVLGRDGVCVSA